MINKLKSKKRFFIPLLVTITFLGFLIRVQVCRELEKNDPQVTNPSVYTDMYTYKLYSEQILKGEYKRDFDYQPFYYAVFLPPIKQFFGFGIWPVILIQCLLSALAIWFASLSSAMLWGRKSGVVTALFMAFLSMLILYTPYYLIATLQSFWVALIAYLLLKYLKFERTHKTVKSMSSCMRWGFLGFIVSLAILTRGNIWFFVPGIVLAYLLIKFTNRGGDKKSFPSICQALFPLVLFVLMVILPQIPFAWKNTEITGKLCGPSTAAGKVLSLGNTPEAPPGGRDAGTGHGPMEYPATCYAWAATAEKISVPKRMWNWFCQEPLAFCELQFRKMLLFWDRREIPNNIAVEHQGLKSPTWLATGLIPADSVVTPRGKMTFITHNIIPSTIALLVFSVAGMFLLICRLIKYSCWKGRSIKCFVLSLCKHIHSHVGQYLILYFIIAYWLGTAAFYILARFRVPIYPLLAIFAGFFINEIFNKVSKKRKIIPIFSIMVLAFVFVTFGYDFYRYKLESGIMRIARPNGVVSLLDEELYMMDNGPFSFGSWQPVELRENVPLVKDFSVPDVPGDWYKAKLIIDLVWDVPGRAIIEINGKKYVLKEDKPIKKAYEFPVTFSKKMHITIIPRKLDCRLYAIADFQRDYQRSTVNGQNLGGEFVCKLVVLNLKDIMK